MTPSRSREAGWTQRARIIWSSVHTLVAALFVCGLWLAGYPGGRIVAVAALLFANSIRHFIFSHLGLPVEVVEESPGNCPACGIGIWMLGLLSQFVIVGLTGGLRSPFVIVTIGPLSGILVAFGWSLKSTR